MIRAGGARSRAPPSRPIAMPSLDRSGLAWCVIDDTAVFLDLAKDRYFRLPDPENTRFIAEEAAGITDRPHQPPAFPLPHGWTPAARRCPAIDEGPFRLADVARSIWVQRRVERRLAARSLEEVLRDLRDSVSSRSFTASIGSHRVRADIRAFQQARLLRTAADRCLSRSIALALCLARHHCRANVILGVKLAPFAAHCWAQHGDVVLNDELEEVRRYQPILVL